MTIWSALVEELKRGTVQSLVGAVIVVAQLLLYTALRHTRPHIRFHKLHDRGNDRVTFLIRNLDSVRYCQRFVVELAPRAAIERIRVHAGPHCEGVQSGDGADRIAVAFAKVPADATFSIKVALAPGAGVELRLAERSELRPRNFDDRLEPFRGVRRFSYFLVRGLAGLAGFVAVLVVGLALDGDRLGWADWAFVGAAIPLALAVFVLVVPTGGKPIVAGYLGWSGASKDWSPPAPAARPDG